MYLVGFRCKPSSTGTIDRCKHAMSTGAHHRRLAVCSTPTLPKCIRCIPEHSSTWSYRLCPQRRLRSPWHTHPGHIHAHLHVWIFGPRSQYTHTCMGSSGYASFSRHNIQLHLTRDPTSNRDYLCGLKQSQPILTTPLLRANSDLLDINDIIFDCAHPTNWRLGAAA